MAASQTDTCQRCSLPIADKKRSSLTQYMFRDLRCRCQTPLRRTPIKLDDRKLATVTKRWSQNDEGLPESNLAHEIFESGTLIGQLYEIQTLLGEGGMGAVYRAKHLRTNRTCALKVLYRNLINEENWKRFQLEAKAISKLSHPCFVKVYDLALHNDNQPFYAMDHLTGATLETILTQTGPLAPDEALEVFAEVADGLAFAHSSGFVHRDLKPANIFIEKLPDGTTSVKILDFGIVKLTGMDRDEQSLTRLGDLFGTPYYMSPEQCLGEPVDARSDIYSLGCTLFEAISGRTVFLGANPLAVVFAHINSTPPQLSKVTNQQLPEGLEALLVQCLAKNPDHRYQNMRQLIAHMRLVLQGKGSLVAASFAARPLNNGKWLSSGKNAGGTQAQISTKNGWARLKEPASIIALFALVLAAFSLAITWRQQTAEPPQSTKPSASASTQATVSPGDSGKKDTEDIFGDRDKPELQWSDSDSLAQQAVDTGAYEKAQKLYDQSYKASQILGPEYQLASTEGMADLGALIGKVDKSYANKIDRLALQAMDSQSLRKALNSAQDGSVASTLLDQSSRLATLLNGSGRFAECQKLLKTALAIGKRYLREDDATMTRCLLALADSYRVNLLEQTSSPELGYRMQAFKNVSRHPPDALFETCVFSIGRYYNVHGQSKLALPFLKQSMDAATKVYGESSQKAAKSSYQQAVCYSALGQKTLADAAAHQALNLVRALNPQELDGDSFYLTGSLEALFKENSSALKDFKRSLAEYEKGPAKNYPLIANCCQQVAEQLPPTSLEKAALLKRRMAILRRIGDLSRAEECRLYRMLSNIYYLNGDLTKEMEVLQAAVVILSNWPSPSAVRKSEIESAAWLAAAYLRKGNLKEAEKTALLFKSWAVQECGLNAYLTARADGLLGSIYADSQRPKEAQLLLEKALAFYRYYTPTANERKDYQESKAQFTAQLSLLKKAKMRH